MDENLDELLRRMTIRNLARIQSGCERDGDVELAQIVAAKLGDVTGSIAATEPPAASA